MALIVAAAVALWRKRYALLLRIDSPTKRIFFLATIVGALVTVALTLVFISLLTVTLCSCHWGYLSYVDPSGHADLPLLVASWCNYYQPNVTERFWSNFTQIGFLGSFAQSQSLLVLKTMLWPLRRLYAWVRMSQYADPLPNVATKSRPSDEGMFTSAANDGAKISECDTFKSMSSDRVKRPGPSPSKLPDQFQPDRTDEQQPLTDGWYYIDHGQQIEPRTARHVKQMMATLPNSGDILVWRVGFHE